MPGGPERRAALKKAPSSLVDHGPEKAANCSKISRAALLLIHHGSKLTGSGNFLAAILVPMLQPVDELFGDAPISVHT